MSSILSLKNRVLEDLETRNIDEEIQKEYFLIMMFFSELAYFKSDTIKETFSDFKYKNLKIYEKNDVQAYLIEFKNFVIVSFRGTLAYNWYQIRADLKYWKKKFMGIRAHSGFVDVLNNISDELEADLRKIENKKIIFTGHSMGAALATLMSLKVKPNDICLFATPKVAGGKKFRKAFDGCKCYRINHKWDWVRLLPPFFLGFYQHICPAITLSTKEYKTPKEAHNLTEYVRLIMESNI